MFYRGLVTGEGTSGWHYLVVLEVGYVSNRFCNAAHCFDTQYAFQGKIGLQFQWTCEIVRGDCNN